MKRSKKYSRIGWILALASIVSSIYIALAFGPRPPISPNEMAVRFVDSALVGIAIYYWGKGIGAKELGA